MSGESRVIVTCMKNECPYILEWIAYHLHIGFTHFVVATNGCSDGTVRMLKNLESAGLVTHVPNPPPHGRGPQKTGYLRCRDVPAVTSADWLMTLDVDEFVNVHEGDGTLDALILGARARTPGANMISLQWLMVGHSGQIAFQDQLVIEQFTRTAHPLQVFPAILRSFKTLYQGGLYRRLGTHRPNEIVEECAADIRWVDGSGNPMPVDYHARGWAGGRDGSGLGIGLGRINHYAVRSVEAFLIKRDRGDVNPARNHFKNTGSGLEYWKLHDWNYVEDRAILRHVPDIRSGIGALKDIGRVGKIHAAGVDWHKAKASELAERPDMTALRQTLVNYSSFKRPFDPGKLRPPERMTV